MDEASLQHTQAMPHILVMCVFLSYRLRFGRCYRMWGNTDLNKHTTLLMVLLNSHNSHARFHASNNSVINDPACELVIKALAHLSERFLRSVSEYTDIQTRPGVCTHQSQLSAYKFTTTELLFAILGYIN